MTDKSESESDILRPPSRDRSKSDDEEDILFEIVNDLFVSIVYFSLRLFQDSNF